MLPPNSAGFDSISPASRDTQRATAISATSWSHRWTVMVGFCPSFGRSIERNVASGGSMKGKTIALAAWPVVPGENGTSTTIPTDGRMTSPDIG